ncbi:MAG: S-methyl-5-thioribose-1-phosphate isomerase, partial [Fidelibacterota bacterium]
EEVVAAIRSMVIRGAPAIGAAGAYGLAMGIGQLKDRDMAEVERLKGVLEGARPTAYDLQHGLEYVFQQAQEAGSWEAKQSAARAAAESYAERSIEACRQIGLIGSELIHEGDGVLTHCNTGALATVDYGTALSVIRMAHEAGKDIFVYVDETRPRLQGAKLTAWELQQEGIPYAVIADNAAGYYMQRGDVDVVITGADRIARNGDAANKIGPYAKAVLAKENDIPFYIAAPRSTIDLSCPSGDDIPIEERDEEEVLSIAGRRIAPAGSRAKNPAFDVTPAKYIKGIITEVGILKPEDIQSIELRDG